MEIKNLKKAAERIRKAVKKKEKIILYGDTDLDGAASVIILEETIKNLGGKISAIYFPDREVEGHGITEKALGFLKKKAPALLIALDCGIGNFKEVKKAKEMGFTIIVIDHHQILDKLPQVEIIVDPKQKGDKYPFKDLATVGIAFKLSLLILKEKMTDNLRNTFLELTALATLADTMPKKADNELFIEEGLAHLENSWRPGIKAFLETDYLKEFPNLNQKAFKMISILNVRDVKDRLPASFRLLTVSSLAEAKKIIKRLLLKSKIRKEATEKTRDEIIGRLMVKEEGPLIFEGDSSFDLALLSSVASTIVKEFSKPTFLFKKMAKESHGTVRVPSGIDSVALMKKCSNLLLTFGGHPRASGFRLKNENLEKFKECLLKNFKP